MYKDKDKQREAQRNWVRQKRIDKKGSTEQGSTSASEGLGLAAACDTVRDAAKPERTAQGNIRVSKLGDDDYVPQCETTRAFIEDRPKRPETGKRGKALPQFEDIIGLHLKGVPKRGKDIKCFADLPPDIQQTINSLIPREL